MVDNGRRSVKVHAPPGGATSNIFGTAPVEAPVQRRRGSETNKQQEVALPPNKTTPRQEINRVQEQPAQPVETRAVHTSVRVRAPPGGQSSIIFG
jgi:hypothetical protein